MPQNGRMKIPPIDGKIWLNSEPLNKSDFEGKVVLFDFWTYSCVNCRRALPYLRRWWDKYKDRGFLLVGIHSPEFDFEKEEWNVGQAAQILGVSWPVVLDNEHKIWNSFANRYWPAKYLADKKGEIVYQHFGEGFYEETEKKIQELLDGKSLPPLEKVLTDRLVQEVCFNPTPELYCGFKRGRISNFSPHQRDGIVFYDKPDFYPSDSVSLEGRFLVRPEYTEAIDRGSRLSLNFRATEVNLVMSPVSWGAILELELNGEQLNETVMGSDVNPAGRVEIYRPDMYNLIKSNMPVQGILGITISEYSPPFRAYAFTFSGCIGG